MGKELRYVVEGALVKCNQSVGKITIPVKSSSNSRIGNKLQITEIDTKRENFVGSFGSCKRHRGTPCKIEMLPKWFNTNASFVTGTGHGCATMASFTACKYGGGAITFVTDGQRMEDIPKILIELENEIYDRFPNTPVGREHAAMIINKLGIDVETNPYKILAWREMLMRDVTRDTIRQEISNGEFWEWGIGSNPENFFTQFDAARQENITALDSLPIIDPTAGLGTRQGNDYKNDFKDPNYPYAYKYTHTGMDVPGCYPLYAAMAGEVQIINANVAKTAGDYYVVTMDSSGTTIYYAHLKSNTVEPGDFVLPGQHIGQTGNEGNSDGDHLHIEVQGSGGSWGKKATAKDPGYLFGVAPSGY